MAGASGTLSETDDAESLRRRIEMLRVACSAALSPTELISIAVAQAKSAVEAAAGVLFLVDGDDLVPAVDDGYPAELMARWSRFPVASDTPAGAAVRERRAQWFSNPAEKSSRYPVLSVARTGFAALAALPLLAGSEVLGVLGISFRVARELSSVERLFLLVLADQVGVALAGMDDQVHGDGGVIDRVMVADPLRRRVTAEVLATVAGARSGFDRSVTVARLMCDTPSAEFSLVAADLVVAGASGAAPAPGTVSPADQSLCTVTMSRRAPLVVRDALTDERLAALQAVWSDGVRGYLGVPVYVDDLIVGALCVYDRRPRSWTRQHEKLLDVLAAGIGTELELNIRAARDGRLLRATEARLHLFDRLAATESVRQMAAVLLQAVADIDGVAGAALAVVDQSTGFRLVDLRGPDVRAAAFLGDVAAHGLSMAGVAVRDLGLIDLIEVLVGDAAYLAELGVLRAVQLFPLEGGADASWVVALTARADHDAVRKELLELMPVVGAVLDRALTYERHELAAGRVAFLTTTSAQLGASLEISDTLQRITRIAVPALAVGCLVHLAGENRFQLAAVSHLDAQVEERVRTELGADPALLRVVGTAPGAGAAADVGLPQWLRADDYRSVPLVARGQLIGVITLLEARPDGRPRLADQALLADLAVRAATAIDHAQLYARRSADVAALQRWLLPTRLTALPGFDVAAYYEAGDDSLEVGGDFYDVVAVSDDRLVLLLGDVCGRGADAGAITGLARAVLRTMVLEGASPAQTLQRLNTAMLTASDRGEFCTAAVIQIDGGGDGCRLRLSVGGHPLPLVRSDGVVREIGRGGPMLGIRRDPFFPESDVPLNPDDVVLLYTDGVTEARRVDEFFGAERLVAALTDAGRLAELIVTGVVGSVKDFADRSNDDIAILALRPRGRLLARIDVPDVHDPAARRDLLQKVREAASLTPAARRRLSGRMVAALAQLQADRPGRAFIDVLQVNDAYRVEISRPGTSATRPPGR
ncbi:MAG: SpoIIE family protein phosphatase [Actinoplanes sp.]